MKDANNIAMTVTQHYIKHHQKYKGSQNVLIGYEKMYRLQSEFVYYAIKETNQIIFSKYKEYHLTVDLNKGVIQENGIVLDYNAITKLRNLFYSQIVV